MLYKTYTELMETLEELLPDAEITLGMQTEDLDASVDNLFLSPVDSQVITADDVPFVLSTTYAMTLLRKDADFTHLRLTEITEAGWTFRGFSKELGLYVYDATVTLYGSDSLPSAT